LSTLSKPADVDVDNGLHWIPQALDFIYTDARNPIMYGGVGASKTYALCRRALRLSLKYPGNRGLLARFTLGSSNDALLVTWRKVVPKQLYSEDTDRWGVVITIRTEGEDSIILVRALDDSQKYESLELGWVGISQMNEQGITADLFDTLDSRVGRWQLPNGEWTRASCFGECNSGAKWIIDRWGPEVDPERRNPDYVAIEVSMYDNASNLNPSYVKAMEAKPAWWKRWWVYSNWEPLSELAGEPVFEGEFDYNAHVAREPVTPLPGCPIVRGWDIPGPIACVWFQIGTDGFTRVLYEQQAGQEMAVEAVKRAVLSTSQTLFPGFGFIDYGDPAAYTRHPTDQRTCAEILRPEVTLVPGEMTLTGRLEALHTVLTTKMGMKDSLVIDPRCRILISAFMGGYVWQEVGGRVLPEPRKNDYSHIMDAFSCALSKASGISPMQRQVMMGPRDFGPPR
jgi:hypothetical protein